jgi:hypothetical protein
MLFVKKVIKKLTNSRESHQHHVEADNFRVQEYFRGTKFILIYIQVKKMVCFSTLLSQKLI